MGDWWAESDEGYQVAITKHGGGFLYQAYAPANPEVRKTWRARYGLGEAIPQPREYLGLATTPDEARAICERHRQGQLATEVSA